MDPSSHPLWDVGTQLNPLALLIRTAANSVAVPVPLVITLVKTVAATLAEVAEPEQVVVQAEANNALAAKTMVANALVAKTIKALVAPACFCADSYRNRNRRRKNRHRLKR